MRKAERGTRNRACGRRGVGPTPRTGPDLAVPRSAFRVPHLLVGAALFALLAAACQGDGRTPLIVYSPHGRDLLTLLERRFEIGRASCRERVWISDGGVGVSYK